MTTAELKRRDSNGDAVDWRLVDDAANTDTGLSDPVVDYGARDALASLETAVTAVYAALTDKSTETRQVALEAAVASLEAAVAAMEATLSGDLATLSGDLASVETAVDAVNATLGGTLTVDNGLVQGVQDGGTVQLGASTLATLGGQHQTDALTDAELRATPVPVDTSSAATLTERMLAKAPAAGYVLWLDTADTGHLYLLEAPVGTASSAVGFQGVRVTLDATGNPVGAVEVNEAGTLTFDNRTTDTGWAS